MILDQIIFYLKIGFTHIMDINAYDHLLFLVSISIIYSFKSWKKLFWIVTFFTIGHSLSLVISSYEISIVKFIFVDSFTLIILYTLSLEFISIVNIK